MEEIYLHLHGPWLVEVIFMQLRACLPERNSFLQCQIIVFKTFLHKSSLNTLLQMPKCLYATYVLISMVEERFLFALTGSLVGGSHFYVVQNLLAQVEFCSLELIKFIILPGRCETLFATLLQPACPIPCNSAFAKGS